MRSSKASKPVHEEGFTIIEVMIVLAIAGLIALLVFQAIPTLTRNARNGARRTSVAAILLATSHYELNNGGSMPPDCGSGTCYSYSNSPYGPAAHLQFYDGSSGSSLVVCDGGYSAGTLTYASGCTPASGPPQEASSDVNKVYLYNYQRCDQAKIGAGTSSGAGYSDVVALYAVESGNGAVGQCQQM
jgi:prepilin-type N-terminal cleavage/methylation domain-containing protein